MLKPPEIIWFLTNGWLVLHENSDLDTDLDLSSVKDMMPLQT